MIPAIHQFDCLTVILLFQLGNDLSAQGRNLLLTLLHVRAPLLSNPGRFDENAFLAGTGRQPENRGDKDKLSDAGSHATALRIAEL